MYYVYSKSTVKAKGGRQVMGDRIWEIGDGRQDSGDRVQVTGYRGQETGDRRQDRKRESGNGRQDMRDGKR